MAPNGGSINGSFRLNGAHAGDDEVFKVREEVLEPKTPEESNKLFIGT